ncbi:hypothetical protein H4S01_000894, partial [Coemansia sp. RSA 2610]
MNGQVLALLSMLVAAANASPVKLQCGTSDCKQIARRDEASGSQGESSSSSGNSGPGATLSQPVVIVIIV